MITKAGKIHDKMAIYLKDKVEKNEPAEIKEVGFVLISDFKSKKIRYVGWF